MEELRVRIVDNWGNSLGVRLPKQYCDWLHIEKGSKVQVKCDRENNRLILTNINREPRDVSHGMDKLSLSMQIVVQTFNTKNVCSQAIDFSRWWLTA